jgi:hypothetical protein
MSQTKTVYNVTKIKLGANRKPIEELESITVTGTGQKAAYAVDKKFRGQFIRKVLVGWILGDDRYVPLELEPKKFK